MLHIAENGREHLADNTKKDKGTILRTPQYKSDQPKGVGTLIQALRKLFRHEFNNLKPQRTSHLHN